MASARGGQRIQTEASEPDDADEPETGKELRESGRFETYRGPADGSTIKLAQDRRVWSR